MAYGDNLIRVTTGAKSGLSMVKGNERMLDLSRHKISYSSSLSIYMLTMLEYVQKLHSQVLE
jgi:hypothetical protein